VRRQVDAGINFLVPCGTTGEVPPCRTRAAARSGNLDRGGAVQESSRACGRGRQQHGGVIERAQEWQALGREWNSFRHPVLQQTTQEGSISTTRRSPRPLGCRSFCNNIPGARASTSSRRRLKRLAEIENIIGVKEASGNIRRWLPCWTSCRSVSMCFRETRHHRPIDVSGWSRLISVVSNEIPAEMTRLAQLCLAGDFTAARAIHRRYFPLMEANFVETNPGPVKAGMALMGLLEPVFRLPLVAAQTGKPGKIRRALESVGLVQGLPMLHVRLKSSSAKKPSATQTITSIFSSDSRTC